MQKKLYIEATPLIEKRMSGVGHVLLELVRELNRTHATHGLKVILFVPFNEKKKMDRYSFENISIKTLPFPHKVFSLMSRLKYSLPLDIFLGKGVYLFPNFRNWNLLSSKSITYIHDICFALYPQYVEQRNLSFLKKYVSMWIGRSSKIVTVSDTSKKEIMDTFGLSDEKVAVIHNGVNLQEYKEMNLEEKASIKRKFGLPGKFFLYVGNIEPRKNLENMINGFRQAKLGKEYGLFLVGGDGWLNEDVYKAIEAAQGEGIFIKKNDAYVEDEDVSLLTRASEGLLLVSHHEGFGMPAVEAQSLGRPVIVSDIPVLKEVTSTEVGDVWYVNKDEPSSIAGAIREVASKPASKSKNPTKVAYTWSKSCEELVDIVNKSTERNL